MKEMKNKYVFVSLMLAVILVVSAGLTLLYVHHQEEEEAVELTVITSFYPMYIAAVNVIGDDEGVNLQNLSEPQSGCLHDYQLTAADMKLLATADVFIVNGGGIEGFLTEVAAQYPDLVIINTGENLELLEDNAHAWMSISLYQEQIQAICDGLVAVDESRAETYIQNTAAYQAKLQALLEEYAFLTEDFADESVIIFHEAYAYLTQEWGIEVSGQLDLDEERQVSAGEVAETLAIIADKQVSLILAEELYGKDMGELMEREAEVTVLYLDPLTRGDYSPDSYLEGMRDNLEQLTAALATLAQ